MLIQFSSTIRWILNTYAMTRYSLYFILVLLFYVVTGTYKYFIQSLLILPQKKMQSIYANRNLKSSDFSLESVASYLKDSFCWTKHVFHLYVVSTIIFVQMKHFTANRVINNRARLKHFIVSLPKSIKAHVKLLLCCQYICLYLLLFLSIISSTWILRR